MDCTLHKLSLITMLEKSCSHLDSFIAHVCLARSKLPVPSGRGINVWSSLFISTGRGACAFAASAAFFWSRFFFARYIGMKRHMLTWNFGKEGVLSYGQSGWNGNSQVAMVSTGTCIWFSQTGHLKHWSRSLSTVYILLYAQVRTPFLIRPFRIRCKIR